MYFWIMISRAAIMGQKTTINKTIEGKFMKKLIVFTIQHDITIEKDAYPYIHYSEVVPSEYLFLDAEGNEID